MARKEFKIKGFDKVKNNLNKEIKGIKGRTMKGLIESAIIVRVDMDKTPPLIPIDTGNLRASWFTVQLRTLKGIGLIMGFSANYAVLVHERVEGAKWGDGVVGKVDWNRDGSGPKFLQASLFRNAPLILKTIQENARI
jgi:hypothetical protein